MQPESDDIVPEHTDKSGRAMVLQGAGQPLRLEERQVSAPGPGEILIRVTACAVCRTDLHLVDGELPNISYPVVPGHEIVGHAVDTGEGVVIEKGARLGVPWLGYTCGRCRFCREQKENLCDEARFTGYQIDGGFADYVLADHRYCFPLPDNYDDQQAAPLLCAGLIGYRCLRMTGQAQNIGIFGFGAAAHIVAQVAAHQGRSIFAFTRPADAAAQDFARSIGAVWAGGSEDDPGIELDAAIIFAPAGELVPRAMARIRKGGTVICGGIHMSDIPSFPYRRLWGERVLRSVANLTRADAREFLEIAPLVPVRTRITTFGLEEANIALDQLRHGRITGAAVLVP